MKTTFEVKNTSTDNPPLDVDLVGGVVKVVGSTMGIVDYDEDIVAIDAWNKTIPERGPNGTKLICNLVDHTASVLKMYGKPSELFVQGNQLVSVTPIVKTSLGMDILKMYDAGLINQQSCGFSTMRDEMNVGTGIRTIKEAKLYEISAVLWGANPITPTLDLMKGLEAEIATKTLKTREQLLMKELRGGTYTDDTFVLMEIELKQLQQAIAQFVATTQPEENKNLEEGIQKFLSSTY